MRDKFTAALTLLVVVGLPATAPAQGLTTLGNRAAALSAFVAVADDASAVAWNPAGLVMGPVFNILLDLEHSRVRPADEPPQAAQPAEQLGATLVAVGLPPVGVSYYRLRMVSLVPLGTAEVGDGSRDSRQVAVRSLVTTNLGGTVLQSVGDYLTVGATVRLVRGHVGVAEAAIDTWDEGVDVAEALEKRGSTTGDVDVGVMFASGRLRAGLVARNLTTPVFAAENGVDEVRIDRHVRAGLAWGNAWPGMSHTIVAFDADLTEVAHPSGDRRDVAAGIERWVQAHRWAVRGGVRASTAGDARPVVSAGGSYAIRSGTYIDVQGARGRAEDWAWGVAARLTY